MAKSSATLRSVEAERTDIPQLAKPAVRYITVTVGGIKPVMTHNPAAMQISGDSDAKRGSRVPDPADEAEAGTYRTEDGTCAVKGTAFERVLQQAAGAWKIKRGTATKLVAHVEALEDLVPLQYEDGTPIREYVIDAQPVRVQRARVIRHRPRFDNWRCTVTLEYDPIIAEAELIVNILSDGLYRFGIHEQRPKKGRARVIDWQVSETRLDEAA